MHKFLACWVVLCMMANRNCCPESVIFPIGSKNILYIGIIFHAKLHWKTLSVLSYYFLTCSFPWFQELVGLIKNTKIPIICMCNDRNHPKIRTLANYCFDLRFQRPRVEQIKVCLCVSVSACTFHLFRFIRIAALLQCYAVFETDCVPTSYYVLF